MPRKRAITAILLLAAIGPLAAQEDPPPLRLKSGRLPPALPARGVRVDEGVRAGAGAAMTLAKAGRTHLIVQFAEFPSEDLVSALESRGLRVLSYVPDNALLIAAGENADFSGLAVNYAGRLEAADKLSALLDRTQDAPGAVVMDFHSDVDMASARRLVLESGLELLENPDVPPGSLLVRGPVGALAAAAELDEVAYIYPASDELLRSEPVVACLGGMMALGQLAAAANLATSFGYGWDGPGLGSVTVLYWLGALTPGLAESSTKAEILRALAAWSEVAAIRWAPAAAARLKGEVEIFFAQRTHGDTFNFDGRGGVLAHTFYPPPNGETLAGDLHLDIEESWRVGADIDVFSVALHELGHALGLGHNDDPNSVMYPHYRRVSGLRPADIAEIRKLYAATPGGVTPPGTPAPPPQPPPAQPPANPPKPGPDTIPPVVTITYPAATSTTSANSITLRGTATDNVGVADVVWVSSTGWSGKAAGLPSYTAGPIPLAPGWNRLTVTARDAAGNWTSRTVSVTRR